MLGAEERTRLCSDTYGREREGAVTGIRWPGIESRSHHQLVHTSLVWKIMGVFFVY